MRERGNFGEAAEREGEGFGVGGKGFARRTVEDEVEENFIHDEGKIMFLAEVVEVEEFLGLDV